MGEVALAAIESWHDMGAFHSSLEAISTSRSGDLPPQLVAKPLFEEPDAVVPHVRICGSPGWATAQGDPTHELVKSRHANESRYDEIDLNPNQQTEPLVTTPLLFQRSDENPVSTQDRIANAGADAQIEESVVNAEVRLALRPNGRKYKAHFLNVFVSLCTANPHRRAIDPEPGDYQPI